MLLILPTPLKTSDVNRDKGLVKSPKIKRKQDVFKSCGCQKIDNDNGESDRATITTLDAQGCVLVCFKTKSNKSQYIYIFRKDLRQK